MWAAELAISSALTPNGAGGCSARGALAMLSGAGVPRSTESAERVGAMSDAVARGFIGAPPARAFTAGA